MNLAVVSRITQDRLVLMDAYKAHPKKWVIVQSTLNAKWKDYPAELFAVRRMAAKPGIPHKKG